MVEINVEISGPGTEALKEVVSGGRGALRRAFGPALNEFGEMLSDQMKLWRFRNLVGIKEKVDQIVAERNVPDTLLHAFTFGDSMRTLEAASQEDEEDIQELWARLIISAACRTDNPSINKLHIEILRGLTPADSALLELLYPSILNREFRSRDEVDAFNASMNAKADLRWRQFSEEDRGVSVQNLIRLRCITATPRILNADGVLKQFSNRERGVSGALVDQRQFQELLSSLITLIYQSAGAVSYDENSPITLHYRSMFGMGHGAFGQIIVPELNHMLTPLGLEFMRAVTLDRANDTGPA